MECIVIAQPAPVRIRQMWQLGRDTMMYPLVQEEMDQDPKGQSRWNDMTSLKTVPCHIASMVALTRWKRKLFQKSERFAGLVGEGLHPHSVGLKVIQELLCKLSKPKTKLKVAFFLLA